MANDRNLAVVVTANLDKMKAEMAKADAVIATTTSAMKKMDTAYSGASTIANANAAMLQVQKLGGATGLTEAEQRKLNATLQAGIDKYTALGKSAPPDMLKLRDATAAAAKQTQDMGAASTSLTDKLRGVAGAMGLAFGAAAVVSGLKSLISGTLDYAEAIKNTSAKMSVSMEAAQRWQFAAEQTGASLEDVSKSVLKLSDGLVTGDKGLKQALAAAGVQFDSLRAMKPEDAFTVVATAIGTIENPMIQAKVALEAFGKSGADLLPALREGFVKVAEGATVMSDDTVRRLDDAKTAWANFGRAVTIYSGEVVGGMMSVSRAFLTDWTTAAQIMKVAGEAGMGAAIAMALGIDKARNSIIELSAAQKLAAAAMDKGGESVQAIAKFLVVSEKNVQAYLDSLKKAPPVLDQFGSKHKETAKTVGESWSGAFGDIFNYSKIVQAEQDALAASMSKVSWSGTAADIDKFNVALRETLNLSTGISWSGVEADLTNLRGIFNNEGTQSGQAFLANFQAAMANLGSVIVGAIQGGGNVLGSIFASLGSALGADLGKGLTGALSGLGPTLAGAIGGILGPLGAMVGGWIGGLFTNQGRNNAIDYAATYGGFDALQARMLTLGDAYDKLWRDLTQNTQGPAQVAAAIRAIEDAFRAQEAAATGAAGASAAAFAGPAGAAGFPTRAELQQAAADAEAAYVYIRDSGLYTAATVKDAFDRWQSSLIAAGDVGAAAMKKIDDEIESIKNNAAFIAEQGAPEYDATGLRIYGAEEQAMIDRLAALEAEKAAAALVSIEEEARAEAAAGAAAEVEAQKAFDDTLTKAKLLDSEMRRLFSQGYDIPFRFNLPSGSGGYSGTPPAYAGEFASGGTVYADRPTYAMFGEAGPETATFTPRRGGSASAGGGDQTIIVQVDGEVIARASAKGMPRYLKLHGRGR